MSEPAKFFGVALDECCGECCGQGFVLSQEWLDWHGRGDEIRAAFPTGWIGTSEYEAFIREMPRCPEEESCIECDGTGFVLTGPGKDLMHFLVRHWSGVS